MKEFRSITQKTSVYLREQSLKSFKMISDGVVFELGLYDGEIKLRVIVGVCQLFTFEASAAAELLKSLITENDGTS